ncbi:methionine--tRNA ligase, mitochondrial [Cimex lectularius]|uniref:Methionine--tRNA ligase, mitochondrial n=1 Tax=Cimex lectularius TaxID=79782 RepID=A0A8I6RXX2_CIMLE|nr:methionine--tRNA ligase, mitochondrial [Cimex lectularius]
MRTLLLLKKINLYVYPRRFKSDCFVTTPIYYVNASPHMGHLYSSLLADAYYRFQLLLGHKEGVFSTGTDEHGIKVQQAAAASGLPLLEYCDKISAEYRNLFDEFAIGYNQFIRTSDQKHKDTVQHYWKILDKKGYIRKGTYKGWYCDADEAFLTEAQVTHVKSNGENSVVSVDSGRPVHWVEEANYEFDLPRVKDRVKTWINSGESIRPKKFQDLCNTWLKEGLMDQPLSVSRPKKRVHWAIEVPGDSEQSIYVWLDALLNYLTVREHLWPPTCQILGKDILKFHGIYWPAFLAALELDMPRSFLVHSHWTVEGEKMSKSKGNVINPRICAEKFGISGVRYFLLREGTPHSDSNYSETKIFRVLNSELADTFGNLLSRSTGSAVNKKQVFPPFDRNNFDKYCKMQASELISLLEILQDEVGEYYSELNFYKGIALVMKVLHTANCFVESMKPWELRKDPSCSAHLDCVLHLSLECLRICSIALTPVIPMLTNKLLDKLSIPVEARTWPDMVPSWKKEFEGSSLAHEKLILYRRIQA